MCVDKIKTNQADKMFTALIIKVLLQKRRFNERNMTGIENVIIFTKTK